MSGVLSVEVIDNQQLSHDAVMLRVRADRWLPGECLPGQFVMASRQTPQSVPSPLLKRALAVYSFVPGAPAIIGLLVKVIGPGTAALAGAAAGECLSLVGPLGHGFDLASAEGKTSLIVAGGVGIASVHQLAVRLAERRQSVHLLYGARTREDLICRNDFDSLGVKITVTTEDGSAGTRGRVTAALPRYRALAAGRLQVFACGPNPMMKAICVWAVQQKVACQISVETRMACGFGVCLGCTVRTADTQQLACTQGPVFEGSTFVWEDGSMAAGCLPGKLSSA